MKKFVCPECGNTSWEILLDKNWIQLNCTKCVYWRHLELKEIESQRKKKVKGKSYPTKGGLLTCTRCGETTPRPECTSKDCKWLCHDCWQNPKRKVKS